jgi:hypothetical protein
MRIPSTGATARLVARATVAAGLLVALVGSPASADPFGTWTSDTGPFADGVGHTYCWGSGFDAALQDNATAALANLDAQTEMFDSFQATCNVVTTDIYFFDANLPAGVRGSTRCVTWKTYGVVCDSFDIEIDPAEINIGSDDEADTTKTLCHEVGHSVGLSHLAPQDDCMISGEMPSTAAQWRKYSAHHVSHINGRY